METNLDTFLSLIKTVNFAISINSITFSIHGIDVHFHFCAYKIFAIVSTYNSKVPIFPPSSLSSSPKRKISDFDYIFIF